MRVSQIAGNLYQVDTIRFYSLPGLEVEKAEKIIKLRGQIEDSLEDHNAVVTVNKWGNMRVCALAKRGEILPDVTARQKRVVDFLHSEGWKINAQGEISLGMPRRKC